MGFFKNIGVSLSPMYMEFLAAKKNLKLPDGSMVLNIVISNLLAGGFVTKQEYLEVKNKYGVNWGTRWAAEPYGAGSDKLGSLNSGDLKLTKVPNQFFNESMIDFLKEMGYNRVKQMRNWFVIRDTSSLRVNEGINPDSCYWE